MTLQKRTVFWTIYLSAYANELTRCLPLVPAPSLVQAPDFLQSKPDLPRPLGHRPFRGRPQPKAVPDPGIDVELRRHLLLVLQVELGHALGDIGPVQVAASNEHGRGVGAHLQAATVAGI
jgi:hypothetical protein